VWWGCAACAAACARKCACASPRVRGNGAKRAPKGVAAVGSAACTGRYSSVSPSARHVALFVVRKTYENRHVHRDGAIRAFALVCSSSSVSPFEVYISVVQTGVCSVAVGAGGNRPESSRVLECRQECGARGYGEMPCGHPRALAARPQQNCSALI